MFTKAKESIKGTLSFFNLIDDHDKKLSWTTVVLILSMFIWANNLNEPAAMGGVVVTVLARMHKKYLASKIDKEQDANIKSLQGQFKEFQDSVKEFDSIKSEVQSNKEELNSLKLKTSIRK